MNPIALIQLAGQLIALASQVAAAVEQGIAEVQTINGQTEPEVDAEIVKLHADSQALTAQLDALKG